MGRGREGGGQALKVSTNRKPNPSPIPTPGPIRPLGLDLAALPSAEVPRLIDVAQHARILHLQAFMRVSVGGNDRVGSRIAL